MKVSCPQIAVFLLLVLVSSACRATTPSALSLEARQAHLQWLEQELVENYPSLHCKEKHGLVNLSDVFGAARKAEQHADPNLTSFYDRMRGVIAQFSDTHLKVYPKTRFPAVHLNLELIDTDSGVRVLNAAPSSAIQPGDRVVAMDRKPIEQVIAELSRLIPGSSELYRRRRALEHLVRRRHHYPQSPKTTWTLERQDGSLYQVEMHYALVSRDEREPSTLALLESRGITLPSTPAPKMSQHRAIDWGPLEQSTVYQGRYGQALRFGVGSIGGHRVGILELTSFPGGEVIDADGNTLSFAEAVATHVRWLEQEKLPMVLDLRRNGGGNGENAFEFLAAIAPEGARYASTTRSHLLNEDARELIDDSQSLHFGYRKYRLPALVRLFAWAQGGMPEIEGYTLLDTYLESQPEPVAGHSPLFSAHGTITPDPRVGGYNQPVIALIGPECVSTCDMLTNMLHFNQRATLVGEPTNGTGNGMVSLGRRGWQPSLSPDGLFYYKVPNKVVGKPLGTKPGLFPAEMLCEEALAENRPAQPTLHHPQQTADIFDSQRVLKAKLKALLD